MLQLGVVEIKYDDGNNLKVTDFGREILTGKRKLELSRAEQPQGNASARGKKDSGNADEASPGTAELFAALRQLRLKLARERGLKPYLVFNDSVLMSIANLKPKTRIQFGMIHGIAERKTELYWKPFTDFIKQWELDR